jgi:phage terminase Nu1 subunit (DNA packaging protein)
LGEIVGKKRLAAILGYSMRSITAWTRSGMPICKVGGRGRENKYDTAEVVAWLLSRDTSGGDPETIAARRRIACAEAGRREIRLSRDRGETIPTALVKRSVDQVFGAFRARLLALPRVAVPRLKGVTGDAAREKALRKLVHEVLTTLSNFDFADLVDEAARELGYNGPRPGNGITPDAGKNSPTKKEK